MIAKSFGDLWYMPHFCVEGQRKEEKLPETLSSQWSWAEYSLTIYNSVDSSGAMQYLPHAELQKKTMCIQF